MAEYGGARSLSYEEDEDNKSPKSIAPPLSAASAAASKTKYEKSGGDGATPSEVSKKPRGRPPGSKNKPKPAVVMRRESEAGMQPMVLEVSAGSDVVDTVAQFARRRHVGLCMLSGSGSVANVTLRHPTSHNATLTIPGRFEILSLSGSLLPPSTTTTTTCSSPPLTISLAGGQGQVIGGAVAGTLTAVSPVVLVAASFVKPAFYRLPGEEDQDQEETKPNMMSHVGMSGTSTPTPLNCQIPADHVLHWAPTSRAPPPYSL